MIEHVACPLCERLVERVEVTRGYPRHGVAVTVWFHKGDQRCFIVDDHYEGEEAGEPGTPFEIVPLENP